MNNYISLSTNYLLRKKSTGEYILYNKKNNMLYTITPKLFSFLYLFKNNGIKLDNIFQYLIKQQIDIDDIKEFCQRREFCDLFSEVDFPINGDGNIYKKLSLPSPFTEYTPERVDFLITKHCNLKCRHCFENSSPSIKTGNIPLELLFDIFKQMDELNVRTLKITGGEPLSHPYITEILQEISKLRFECIILTNGMLLTPELINIIAKGNIKLGISLDGITETSHDFLRGIGAYRILLTNLHKLKKTGIHFSITVSVNKKNSTELEDLAKFVIEDLGAQRLFVNQLKPLGRAKINDNIFLSEIDYQSVVSRVNILINKYGEKRITLSDDVLLKEEFNTDKTSTILQQNPLVCAAGNSSLSIDDKLDVYPCIYANGTPLFKMGNLKTQSIIEIWTSKKWNIFRGETLLKDIPGCNTCPHSISCGMKNCRLKPVYNGQSFYSHVTYCNYDTIAK